VGLASVHTWLWLSGWNADKRKTDPAGPANVAILLGVVYLVTTIGLTVILEVEPSLSTYAPALFPLLAVVGAVNLALIAQQEQREAAVNLERQERRLARQNAQQVHRNTAQDVHSRNAQQGQSSAQQGAQNDALCAINRTRQERKAALMCALLDTYHDNPDMGATEAARILGVHRNTIYGYTDELQAAGKLRRNGDGWEVMTQ
jgi:hypothetical protein